jgi:protein tyrosine phosphatase
MLFTRKYFNSMGGFEKSSQAEGVKFIQNQDKNVFNTDIFNVLINVGHGTNTIDKEQFNIEKLKLEGWETYTGPERDILNKILDIK